MCHSVPTLELAQESHRAETRVSSLCHLPAKEFIVTFNFVILVSLHQCILPPSSYLHFQISHDLFPRVVVLYYSSCFMMSQGVSCMVSCGVSLSLSKFIELSLHASLAYSISKYNHVLPASFSMFKMDCTDRPNIQFWMT